MAIADNKKVHASRIVELDIFHVKDFYGCGVHGGEKVNCCRLRSLCVQVFSRMLFVVIFIVAFRNVYCMVGR